MSRVGDFGWRLRRRTLAATRFGYWAVGTAVLGHLGASLGLSMQLARAGFEPLAMMTREAVTAWSCLVVLSFAALVFVDRQLPETDRVFP